MKDVSDFAEPRLFLERNPDIRYVDALYVDICGRPRGKRCPVDKLASLYAEGVQSPQSHFLLDVNGDSSDPVGRGFSDGDPDTTLHPVPGSLALVPWANEPLGQVLIGERAGERAGFPVDPRLILAKAAEPLAELGLKPVMAVELEFYLFEPEPDAEGRPRLAASPFGGGRTTTATNSIEELEAIGGFLGEVESFCRQQQIPASVVSSEMAAGQFEINLHHVDQPVLAGDHALLLRRVIQMAARRHGMRASFMPKPFLDAAGSGMHVHVSLVDAEGRNLFDDGSAAGSALLRQAIGGLHQAMPESQALFAPSLNAFRRFGPGQFVPLNRFWGYNNRAVAFRVPAGPAAARRIEHRVAGADANPCLVLAAILAAIHHGLEAKADPGPPREGNVVEEDAGLSFDLAAALDRLGSGEILGRYIDPGYLQVYAEVKRAERARFLDHIARREYDWYL
jgi:glutamine synthetase